MNDKQRNYRIRKILFSLFFMYTIWSMIFMSSCAGKKQAEQSSIRVKVKATAVIRGNVNHMIQATGKVDVLKKVDINSPVQGVVTELLVREGDFLKKGSTVARIRPIEAEAAIRGSVSLPATMKRYFLRLGIISLSSPFNGYVSKRYVSSNALVQANAPIVTVEDLSSTYLHVDLPSIYLEQVGIGDAVLIHFLSLPGDVFKGRIVTINPTVSQETQTVKLNVSFPNRDQDIKDGMFAVVDIISSTHKNTLIVPKDAILFDPDTGREYVMVVRQDSIARSVTVKTGYEEDDRVEILKGLSQGQLVITQGNYALADGTSIKVETNSPVNKPIQTKSPQKGND
ncbi:MAG: efflux RND transporter periplasmic adaptor subunit [Deltaproteobacteria bacterium]|nr:efflux RND transporter periplasmic adaptor subunit [Deltaproteobacteria bacterium]MCL5791783.1 efflux RND transporter periplasmic adaptor subunit [Deltaproteobacteria bacterium]